MAGAHGTKPIDLSMVVWASLVLTLVYASLGCRPATPATPTVTATVATSTKPVSTTTLTGARPTATPTRRLPTATPTKVAPTATPTAQGPQVVLEGMAFIVELAVTPQERARGLMERPSLGRDRGMLFIFESDGLPGLWMRGMLISLDFVWIDAEGVVAGVTADVLPAPEGGQPPLYYPPRPVRYVLEINAGMAEKVGIGAGSRATILGIPLDGGS